jgi:hypothetical protein
MFKVGDKVRVKKHCEYSWNKALRRVPLKIIGFSGQSASLICDTWPTSFHMPLDQLEKYGGRSIVEVLNS